MIDLYAKALTYGIAISSIDQNYFSAKYMLEDDFVSGSIFVIDGKKMINTKIVNPNKSVDAPLLHKSNRGDDYFLYKGQRISVSPVKQPKIIVEGGGQLGKSVKDYFRMHTEKTLFISSIRECVFIKDGNACGFCTYEQGIPRALPPELIRTVYQKISNEIGFNPAVALGSGTPNKKDHGVRYNAKIVSLLKKSGCPGISVELVPPHNIADIDLLFDAGCGSLITSIEIWGDGARKRAIPGKSYISKKHYIETWKRAVTKLGRGKVSSVLIVGLDSISSTKDAISTMTKMGVVPTLIPYRKYDKSQIDAMFTPSPDEYIQLSRFNAMCMLKNHIGPFMQVGCTGCGGCSLDSDLTPDPKFTEQYAE